MHETKCNDMWPAEALRKGTTWDFSWKLSYWCGCVTVALFAEYNGEGFTQKYSSEAEIILWWFLCTGIVPFNFRKTGIFSHNIVHVWTSFVPISTNYMLQIICECKTPHCEAQFSGGLKKRKFKFHFTVPYWQNSYLCRVVPFLWKGHINLVV